MNKTTKLLCAGVLVLSTCLMLMNREDKMYQKKKVFTSSDELIQQLDGVVVRDNIYHDLTEDMLECVSQRARLTDIQIYANNLEVKEVIELDDETKNKILKTYHNQKQYYTKGRPVTSEEVVRLKIINYDSGGYSYEGYLDLVLIDEGEGLVIDFSNTYDEDSHGRYEYTSYIAKDDENA